MRLLEVHKPLRRPSRAAAVAVHHLSHRATMSFSFSSNFSSYRFLIGYFLVFPLLFLSAQVVKASEFCRCVLFNNSGTFHSADYPKSLHPVDCLTFHFQAPPNHLIRLNFDFFSLPQRDTRCSSYVRTYEQSLDGFLDDSTPFDEEFCGRELPTGRPFYSLDRHFVLAIHTLTICKGFSGTHEFLKKSDYKSDAIEVSQCGFRASQEKGKVFSPQYPYFYPSQLNCSYHFPPRRKQRVVLKQHHLDVHPSSLLALTPIDEQGRAGDVVAFSSSSVHVADGFLLHFHSDEKSALRAAGFEIGYSYEDTDELETREDAVLGMDDNGLLPSFGVPNLMNLSVQEDCSVRITPAKGLQGEVSSDELFKQHTPPAHLPFRCQLSFVGQPAHKVSLQFTHFNLFHYDNPNSTKKCVEMDHVTADVLVGERLSRIDAWCGSSTPPQLMSSSNVISLQYHTKSSQARRDNFPHEKFGFTIKYKFHTDWGDMPATWDPARGCRFVFNGSRQVSGKLWSVNHPGLYPRGIHCEYIFHGGEDQIVHIHFEYFDVEGFSTCDEASHSDYVLFSNYQTHDRTNRRFCGKEAPKGPILSESNYFRMIFSTNDIFDATGFYAHYQFITQQKTQISRVKLASSSLSMPANVETIVTVVIVLLSCILRLQ